MNRVFLVYLVTTCLLYRGVYGHDRYRCLWLSVVSSVLLGVSLLTTEGPSDRALPLIVMSVFLFFTLICAKWLTAKLSKKTRFRVLFAGVIYFPVLACVSLAVESFDHETDEIYFDWYSMLHLIALPVSLFVGWRGRTFALILSSTAVFGLAYGSSWYSSVLHEHSKLTFPAAVRLSAPIASLLVGWWRAGWESRFYSLLLCLLVADMFLFPISAVWLVLCFAVAHRYTTGDKWKGVESKMAVLVLEDSPSIRSTTDGGISA